MHFENHSILLVNASFSCGEDRSRKFELGSCKPVVDLRLVRFDHVWSNNFQRPKGSNKKKKKNKREYRRNASEKKWIITWSQHHPNNSSVTFSFIRKLVPNPSGIFKEAVLSLNFSISLSFSSLSMPNSFLNPFSVPWSNIHVVVWASLVSS